MPKRVFIETTIPSYLAARPARDLRQAARQQITHDWWQHRRHRFDLCTSQIVLNEAAAGDSEVATQRAVFLDGIPLLDITVPVEQLADAILRSGLLPPKAARDAFHIAVVAVHEIDILLTWNCRHIANASILRELEDVVAAQGYRIPILCTPEELLDDLQEE